MSKILNLNLILRKKRNKENLCLILRKKTKNENRLRGRFAVRVIRNRD